MTQQVLINRWKAIPVINGGYQLADSTHPLSWFVGYSDIGRLTLMLIAKRPSKLLKSSKSIEYQQKRRETDGLWTLSFDLVISEQTEVFALFCSDIIEYSRRANSEEDGICKVEERWNQWALLLEKQRKPMLSASEQLGLLGELAFIRHLIQTGEDTDTVINAWAGPEGADRDFEFESLWYEVKTTGVSTQTVTISSLEQLDSEREGKLIIVRADRCSPEIKDGVSLDDLVSSIQKKLAGSLSTLNLFSRKLMSVGYLSGAEYTANKYKISNIAAYRVETGFPKILRTQVPTEITNVRYELSIAAIAQWKE